MDWTKFNNHGESNNHAFEVMCNMLFEKWCRAEYAEEIDALSFVNGSGGDGGIEAFVTLKDGSITGIQSKWFPEKIELAQINQIKNSFKTALKIRPNITKYIVCIPRDLGSLKMGKGQVPVSNTEAGRWNNLVGELKNDYQSTEIVLWDETTLQTRLTQPNTQGIYKFWFENTVIFVDQIKMAYEKAITSWEKSKYIPEVYSFGYIHDKMDYFLGSDDLSKKKFDSLKKFYDRLEALKRAFNDLLSLGFPEKEQELQRKIEQDIPALETWMCILETSLNSAYYGAHIDFGANTFELKCKDTDIKDSSLHFGSYFHFHETESILENIEDDFYYMKEFVEDYPDNRVVILGNPGTGKSCGIVAETGDFLKNGTHLPILINAKDFSDNETWSEIIEKAIGLSTTWNEEELMVALENAAILAYKGENTNYRHEAKCVICVDGIDEAESIEFWKRKIDEAIIYYEKYTHIRFVFLSRPYVFEPVYELAYSNQVFRLPVAGDISIEELCDKYFKHYKINIGNNVWIKSLLRTPSSVRLFCELYEGRTINDLSKNTLVITNLFKRKLEITEEKYNRFQETKNKSVVLSSVLIDIATLFTEKSDISYSDICDRVSDEIKHDLYNVINFLIEEGFMYSFSKKQDAFSKPILMYSWGSQPALDYLIAQKVYAALESGIENIPCYDFGIYQMLALILIEEGKMLFQFPALNLNANEMFDAICYSLANCSLDVALDNKNYVKSLMAASPAQFREVVEKVILPTAAIDTHPLGVCLLDEFLRSFKFSAERDVWWSIPPYLRDCYAAKWRTNTEIDFSSIELNKNEFCAGLPILLAWSLSSVNNEVRQHGRCELTKWGIGNPAEYWKLFCHFMDINDEQVIEDLFAIAYGISLDQFVSLEYILTAAEWLLENVFSSDGLKKYENTAIRYYASGVIKIAITRGIISEDRKEIINPPYSYSTDCMPLSVEALKGERMGGYSAIDYDLSRYVLCDQLDDYFRKAYRNDSYSKETQAFIDRYKIKYEIEEFKIDGFIISLAYQYLLNQGWTEEKFWSYQNQDDVGVDIAIRRTHYPATHGQKSKIMSVAEKNVWIAKHRIQAVFANELPLVSYRDEIEYVDDYSQIEDFVNTYQDLVNYTQKTQKQEWFNMELLANPAFFEMSEENILSWMDEDFLPDFSRWLGSFDGMTLLYTFTNVVNKLSGVEEAIWISAGIVNEEDFSDYISSLDQYFDGRDTILNVSDFQAGQVSRCYCTPQEVCLIHADKEVESTQEYEFNEKEIKLFRVVETCLSSDELEVERHFTLPAAFTRNLCGIVYGNGFEYTDKEGRVVAKFSQNGENWGTQQNTLKIDTEILQKAVETNRYKMFWLCRVYREPSNKARERFTSIQHNTDSTFVVWIEDEQYKHKKLDEIKPEYSNVMNLEANSIMELLAHYSETDESEVPSEITIWDE